MINASDTLILIENKFNLFDLKIRDFHIWWICRQKVYEALSDINQSASSSSSSKLSKIKTAAFLAKSATFKKNKYKHSDILCISNTASRRLFEGKYFDMSFDYIGKYDPDQCYAMLNTLSGKGYLKNCYTKTCYNMTNFSLYANFYRKFNKLFLKSSEIQKLTETFSNVEKFLSEEYDIKLDLCGIVLENTAMLLKQYKTACTILKAISPKVLYVDCAYCPTHIIFVYAAKELGIKVVEFQHGLISAGHAGYIYGNSTELNPPIPDYICVYGSYFKELIKSMNPDRNIGLIEYGYPFLYENRLSYTSNDSCKKYDFLITTQGAAYSQNWCSFIIRLLELNPGLKIMVKPHPNETNECYELYKQITDLPGVYFETQKNLYECFKDCRSHISCFSTCHFEAIVFNIPTYVIKFPGWWHVESLLEYNVDFFESADDFSTFLNSGHTCSIEFERFKKDYFNLSPELPIEELSHKIKSVNDYFLKD